MPPPRSDFDQELQALEAELRRLEADYNMFFAGRLPRLPWDQRARVDALMKRYDRMQIKNTGDRFRFQTIQSRWAAFAELWDRQLKAQEGGRRGRGERPGVRGGAPPSPAPSGPAPPVREGVVGSARISDPAAQGERVRDLYQQVTAARQTMGEKPIEFERFAAVVQAQVKKLGQGGREVAFRVALKEGKVTLTATPGEE